MNFSKPPRNNEDDFNDGQKLFSGYTSQQFCPAWYSAFLAVVAYCALILFFFCMHILNENSFVKKLFIHGKTLCIFMLSSMAPKRFHLWFLSSLHSFCLHTWRSFDACLAFNQNTSKRKWRDRFSSSCTRNFLLGVFCVPYTMLDFLGFPFWLN